LVDQHPHQVVLMGENVFYRDEARLARSLVDSGAIGAPQLITQRWLNRLVPTPGNFSGTPWRYRQPAYRGGPLLDGGVHGIAALRLLAGDITDISARTGWVNATMEAPSALAMAFTTGSGAIGDCGWGFFGGPVPEPGNETRLIGQSGGLILRMGQVIHTGADGRATEYRVVDGSDGGFYNQWLNFADAVQHGEPLVGTVRQSYANMLVVLDALDLAETGRVSGDSANWQPGGVPLWRPRGAAGLFDSLPTQVRQTAL
jgi:predicted dehydrogenase